MEERCDESCGVVVSQASVMDAVVNSIEKECAQSTLTSSPGTPMTSGICPSPAPSNCSLLSEHEPGDPNSLSRQSPFLSLNQASPCSNFGGIFCRPDLTAGSMPDSETSSRSSLDGISLSKEYRNRRRRRNSSDSSSSGESLITVNELDDETGSRKSSISRFKAEAACLPVPRGADAPRGRIANIRRESNCSIDTEVAHEKLVKVQQQVSVGFDEFSLDNLQNMEHRRRTASVSSLSGEITVSVNNAFAPSCSPSPTRVVEPASKQCYSPSTHQVIRANITYASPCASPSPSPNRQRLFSNCSRSQSPMSGLQTVVRPVSLKRRNTNSAEESELAMAAKRQGILRTSTSPLVTDRTFPYPTSSSGSASSVAMCSTSNTSQSGGMGSQPPTQQEFALPQLFGPHPIQFGPAISATGGARSASAFADMRRACVLDAAAGMMPPPMMNDDSMMGEESGPSTSRTSSADVSMEEDSLGRSALPEASSCSLSESNDTYNDNVIQNNASEQRSAEDSRPTQMVRTEESPGRSMNRVDDVLAENKPVHDLKRDNEIQTEHAPVTSSPCEGHLNVNFITTETDVLQQEALNAPLPDDDDDL